jgi:nucleotidyltransferase AbiEii toxin of type IV toxin-antitoxin system
MTLLREEHDDFAGAIARAAEELGLAPLFVEKDYWVTQVLRVLAQRYPGAFVFKGGTSLSKGYHLIERFSEDVDILVTPRSGDSAKDRERQLRTMTQGVAEELGVGTLEARPPGRGRSPHRADVLAYPRIVHSGVGVPGEDRGVLLETGYAGGEWPAEMVTVAPLLSAPLGLRPGEYPDTDPFTVRALHPARTLLEKVSLLHHLATSREQDSTLAEQRCGRHYYDIYRLLDHPPTRAALEDRGQFERILAEMQVISATHYGGWTERPHQGYAAGPAFSPAAGSPLRHWLEERYRDAAGLLPARVAGRWPSFGNVLKRVEDHSRLL